MASIHRSVSAHRAAIQRLWGDEEQHPAGPGWSNCRMHPFGWLSGSPAQNLASMMGAEQPRLAFLPESVALPGSFSPGQAITNPLLPS